MPTNFDDVTTIENNRQVRVNVGATLVAIFRIREPLNLEGALSVQKESARIHLQRSVIELNTSNSIKKFGLQE